MTVAFQVPNPPQVGLGGFNSTRQRAGLQLQMVQPPFQLGGRPSGVVAFNAGACPSAQSIVSQPPRQRWSA
ncbi:MAG: hypothetical protein HQL91_09055 [Magnetococcales bacterium]|nr:hypothetical protein [Magnetococcales bacterium]